MEDNENQSYKELLPPEYFKNKMPLSEKSCETVNKNREEIINILNCKSNKRIFIVGPCSIHNYKEAIEYSLKLKELSEKVKDKILLLMRVYLEKPRTTIGWKGFINDPFLDSSFDISKGIEISRKLLLELNENGVGVATEFLDILVNPYINDLVSIGTIGARTTESQTHRQMVSGLFLPVGYKNATSGKIDPAINAIKASINPHHFIGIDDSGKAAIVSTRGNKNCFLILRGGDSGPNYEKEFVLEVKERLSEEGLKPNIVIDCSHGNSLKDYRRQSEVFRDVVFQMKDNKNIIGLMLESNLFEGSQDISKDSLKLKKGVSITDGCISFKETEKLVMDAYNVL